MLLLRYHANNIYIYIFIRSYDNSIHTMLYNDVENSIYNYYPLFDV